MSGCELPPGAAFFGVEVSTVPPPAPPAPDATNSSKCGSWGPGEVGNCQTPTNPESASDGAQRIFRASFRSATFQGMATAYPMDHVPGPGPPQGAGFVFVQTPKMTVSGCPSGTVQLGVGNQQHGLRFDPTGEPEGKGGITGGGVLVHSFLGFAVFDGPAPWPPDTTCWPKRGSLVPWGPKRAKAESQRLTVRGPFPADLSSNRITRLGPPQRVSHFNAQDFGQFRAVSCGWALWLQKWRKQPKSGPAGEAQGNCLHCRLRIQAVWLSSVGSFGWFSPPPAGIAARGAPLFRSGAGGFLTVIQKQLRSDS